MQRVLQPLFAIGRRDTICATICATNMHKTRLCSDRIFFLTNALLKEANSAGGRLRGLAIYFGFLQFPQFPKYAKFPEFPRRRILRPDAGRYYGDSGRRGVRICGVAIGGIPGPISGVNSLLSPVFWGGAPAPQAPHTPPLFAMIFRGFPEYPQLPKFAKFQEFLRRRILRLEMSH